MRGSVRIASVGGIPIRVHWTFLFLPLLVALVPSGHGWEAVVEGLLWILAVFASVTVHELAHSLVARRRGLRVVDIVLLPIGGVSEIYGIERTWADEMATAVVGPAASFLLAGVFALAGLATHQSIWPPTLFAGPWVSRLLWVNVLLGAFNLLPALPLDGGRVLHAALVRRSGPVVGTLQAARVARVLAVALFVVGLFWDIWLALIGLFVFVAAAEEQRRALMRGALAGWKVRELMVPEAPLPATTVVTRDLIETRASADRATPVVDEGGSYVGIVEASALTRGRDRTLGEIADRVAPLLDEDMDVVPTALDAFDESGRMALAVARAERVTGVLYLQQAARAVADGARPHAA